MKILEFQNFLKETSIDLALFFNNDANITYFANVTPDMACLAIPASGLPLLFVPGFEAQRMAESSSVEVVQASKDFLKTVHDRFPAKKIGIVTSEIAYSVVQKLKSEWRAELISVEEKCRDLRLIKTNEEITHITRACAITDHILNELFEALPYFNTELDAATFLKMRMSLYGLEPSFPPIIASGKNGATPHHVPTHDKLAGFTVIDFGIIYKNYCSDITRTVFIGNPTEKDKKVYNRVLKVQEACIKMVLPGKTLEQIDEYAHAQIGKPMIHRLGHSVGIEVHDVQPRPWTLQPGNIVTVEPGIYYPGKFGIRIEDDVLVTRTVPVLLTRSPKDLIAISSKL